MEVYVAMIWEANENASYYDWNISCATFSTYHEAHEYMKAHIMEEGYFIKISANKAELLDEDTQEIVKLIQIVKTEVDEYAKR